jgi:osmoprotectant transport system permease protein
MNVNFQERLNELPPNLANHLMITVIALLAGLLVSLPAAVALAKWRRMRYPALTTAGVIQTIPSLALLALMVPLLDRTAGLGLGLQAFGFYPAVIALSLYSILPILRNTVTGIVGVDPALTEAARGVGMTGFQTLYKVELPLAAPVIIAGIRTSTVWVVGIATLATPVGQRCLGNYIFTGLQTRNWLMVMFGVVSAALLAILLDLLIGGVQKAVEQRRRRLGMVSGIALLAIVAGGLVSPSVVRALRAWTREAPVAAPGTPTTQNVAAPRRVIRIGAKTFTEQYILASLIDRTLRDAGYETLRRESLGSTIVFDALANGDIDVYVDYTGTIWANYMDRSRAAAPWKVLSIVEGWLADRHGVRCLGSLGFENAYALAMRREQAERLGIRTIADLARHADDMKIGGDYEFFGRPEWRQLRDVYGLRFADQISYDSSLMYQAVAQGQVDVISAFSSDGRIIAYDLVILKDPWNVIPPYDAVLLLGPAVANDDALVRTLQPLIGAIDVQLMREANQQVDRSDDKQTVEQAAGWLHDQIVPDSTGPAAPASAPG